VCREVCRGAAAALGVPRAAVAVGRVRDAPGSRVRAAAARGAPAARSDGAPGPQVRLVVGSVVDLLVSVQRGSEAIARARALRLAAADGSLGEALPPPPLPSY
jgi:hypothetical protein